MTWFAVWSVVMAASALCAWWLTVRPGASQRGSAPTVSIMIIAMAVLMAGLAIRGQGAAAQTPVQAAAMLR